VRREPGACGSGREEFDMLGDARSHIRPMSARALPWWTRCSAFTAPVLLIGSWTVAAARQPSGYDPVAQTISALAAVGAGDRWIMTLGLAGVGVCHLLTGLGLRPAAPVGRLVLAGGGVMTIAVAAYPLPGDGRSSTAHGVAAGAAFAALAIWPALAWRGRVDPIGVLRRSVALGASGMLLGLVGWFVVELVAGVRVGLAERVAAGAQSMWPLVVVLFAGVDLGRRRGPWPGTCRVTAATREVPG
jgi:Protein of unknown function (DUF998)